MRLRGVLQKGHRAVNAFVAVGIVVQFWAAGWAAFGNPFTIHAALGWALIPMALISALLALAGHGRDRRSALAASLVVVLALQPILVFVLSAVSPAITAFHPVNGVIALAIAARLEWLARDRHRCGRSRAPAPAAEG